MNANLQDTEAMRQNLRLKVIAVARKAFYAKGVRNVTMDEIAHELVMSKRTIYQLFADKESLLLACLEDGNRAHSRLLEAKTRETDNVLEIILFDLSTRLELLEKINPKFFAELSKFPRIVTHLKRERLQHMERAVLFMKKGVAQGLFRADVNFKIVITILMEHIDGAVTLQELSDFDPVEVFRHLVLFYLRGCTTRRGMEMMDDFLSRRG